MRSAEKSRSTLRRPSSAKHLACAGSRRTARMASERAAVKSNGRNLAGDCREQGIVESFKKRRQEKDVERGVNAVDIVDETSEDHRTRDVQFLRESLEARPAWSIAREQQTQGRELLVEFRECANQPFLAFVR